MSETYPVTVTVYQDASGDWRWRAQAGNNKVVATSGEGYRNESHARAMAARLFPHATKVTQLSGDTIVRSGEASGHAP